MFPNHYAVYLHVTPARSLFGREVRAFSHGCIRLDKKWELLPNLTNMNPMFGIWKKLIPFFHSSILPFFHPSILPSFHPSIH